MLLVHAKFDYNKAPNKTTGASPFKVVYGVDPLRPPDLVPKAMDKKQE